MWIEKHILMPPMEFEKLFRAQKLNPELVSKVQQLLERKRSGEESDMEDRIKTINDFLEEKRREDKIFRGLHNSFCSLPNFHFLS